MSPADQVLFDQWITRRDASAFTCLAEKYAAMVYAVGRRITGNTHDAEDVAQAAFEALASQRRAPRVHLGVWLHRVATYRALNHLKSQQRRAEREARYERERPKHTEIGWDDIYELVDEAIAALPDKQRDVVVAHYLEGKTHDAIARELGVSRPAVTQRVQAGVAGIRAALGKRGVAVPLAALGALLANGAASAAPVALAAQLAKIALSGYAGKTGMGIGLWQGVMAGMGTAKGIAAGALVVVAAGLGIAGLARVERGSLAHVESSPLSNLTVDTISADTNVSSSATAAAAVEAAAPTAIFAASSQGARIYGKVVDTKGISVAGAQVQLSGSEDLRRGAGWVSEEDGSFEFANVVPTDSCWVIAFKGDGEQTRRGSQAELKPVLSGESYEVVLTLYDGVIAGRVLDGHARPMSGVEVLASPQWHYRGGLPTATTGEDGRYRIAGVMEGEYEMQIKVVEGSYFETGVKVRSDGVGVRSEVNLVYKPADIGVLHGRVTNEDGEPLDRAYVAINLTVAPHTSQWTFSDAEGYYEIKGMPEGPNLAHAEHFDYGDAAARDVALDNDPVDFVLPRRGTVNGQVVRKDTGAAIPQFEILTWEPSSDIHYFMGSEQWKPYSDPEGRFSIGLKPGGQTLRVRAKGFSEWSEALQVPAGDTLEDIQVVLRNARSIRGLVVDAATGAPVSGARIFRGRVPDELHDSSKIVAHTDEAGVFVLEDASPGGESFSVTHPSYAAISARTAPRESELVVKMGSGVEVTGKVTLNGEPVEGAEVQARGDHDALPAPVRDTTDGNGRFTLKRLRETDITIRAKLDLLDAPHVRSMLFTPGATWRAGRDPIHFDFVQGRAGLSVTMIKGSEKRPGIEVSASKDSGNGYMETVSVTTDREGRAFFQELYEGKWGIQIIPPEPIGQRDVIRSFQTLIDDQILSLEYDLEQRIETVNIVSFPDPHTVSPPLSLESGGGEE